MCLNGEAAWLSPLQHHQNDMIAEDAHIVE
jgi:hypothetical protein